MNGLMLFIGLPAGLPGHQGIYFGSSPLCGVGRSRAKDGTFMCMLIGLAPKHHIRTSGGKSI